MTMTEHSLRQHLREQVAGTVSRWSHESERVSGRAPLLEDQEVYAAKVINDLLHQRAREAMVSGRPPLSEEQERRIRDWVLRAVSQASAPIDHLLSVPSVTDVFINGWEDVRLRHLDGREQRVEPFATSDEELIDIFQQLARRASSVERSWTPATPFLDLYLEGYQARVAAVAWASQRPAIAIRRHPLVDAALDDLLARGMFDRGVASFLGAAVCARKNILVVGGQGSGKTTLLRALAHCFDVDERVLVLESQPELHLGADPRRHSHIVLLFERPANAEGAGGTDLADHAWHIKRQNPDRIVVGECRGGEVYPMLEAMSQGIDGSLATMHAKNTRSVFPRLVAYAHQSAANMDREDIYELSAEALDLIVFCRRVPGTERRQVAEIRHIERYEPATHVIRTNEVFVPGRDGDAVLNPSAPMPGELLHELIGFGYDPALHPVLAGGWG